MTKEDALERWCPMARQTFADHGSYNRKDNGNPDPACMCIVDKCALWVWENNIDDYGHCGLAK